MPRTWSTDLQTIHQAYHRRDTLDLYLANGTVKRLSRGAVVRSGNTYLNYIKSVGDMESSVEKSVDRLTISCQNVNSILGFDLASNLRLLDYAVADYGKIYQSVRNPVLIDDDSQVFRGVVANAEATETDFSLELIVDYESLGKILASRGLSARCSARYKNGIECTSASSLVDCPKDRPACKIRGKEWESLGWEFFEEPAATAPGTGGGGIGGGNCFTGDVLIWTPKRGALPIELIYKEFYAGKRDVYSFHEYSGEVVEDEIIAVKKHRVKGYFTFEFEDGTIINVTSEHRFWRGLGKFVSADSLVCGLLLRRYDKFWNEVRLVKIKWNSDIEAIVYNLHVRYNQTYFANRFGVHNYKDIPEIL